MKDIEYVHGPSPLVFLAHEELDSSLETVPLLLTRHPTRADRRRTFKIVEIVSCRSIVSK